MTGRDNTRTPVRVGFHCFQRLYHCTHPPSYEERHIEGRTVAILDIPAGLSMPYMVRHNGREDTSVSSGGTSALASREQRLRLFGQGGLLNIESLPVTGTSCADHDFDRIRYYISEALWYTDMPPTQQAPPGTHCCRISAFWSLILEAKSPLLLQHCPALGKTPVDTFAVQVFDSWPLTVGTRSTVPAMAHTRRDRWWLVSISAPQGDGLSMMVSSNGFIGAIMPFITERPDSVSETWRREQDVGWSAFDAKSLYDGYPQRL